jgi:hypothetical protein
MVWRKVLIITSVTFTQIFNFTSLLTLQHSLDQLDWQNWFLHHSNYQHFLKEHLVERVLSSHFLNNISNAFFFTFSQQHLKRVLFHIFSKNISNAVLKATTWTSPYRCNTAHAPSGPLAPPLSWHWRRWRWNEQTAKRCWRENGLNFLFRSLLASGWKNSRV